MRVAILAAVLSSLVPLEPLAAPAGGPVMVKDQGYVPFADAPIYVFDPRICTTRLRGFRRNWTGASSRWSMNRDTAT